MIKLGVILSKEKEAFNTVLHCENDNICLISTYFIQIITCYKQYACNTPLQHGSFSYQELKCPHKCINCSKEVYTVTYTQTYGCTMTFVINQLTGNNFIKVQVISIILGWTNVVQFKPKES